MPDPVTTAPRTTGGSADRGPAAGEEIVLDAVTKTYPGASAPAVEAVSMVFPAGALVALVGPSGCGKTTTMKMINRIIEPTAGSITIGGREVTGMDPDRLRRDIGYVIQQIGLFPHMTVAANIGVVPSLLGWDKRRTAARVEELLDLVGLDAGQGARFPRQLSGGQQQRAGVARALAGDPPVMLMDEPFGATDPITRARLQEEFLQLQHRLRKTIIFVTHDFDEAVRLGDRIAVLGERSRIVQYDTPDAILADPADEYVASFIGQGAALRRLGLLAVADAPLRPARPGDERLPQVLAADTLRHALDRCVAGAAPGVLVREDAAGVAGPGAVVGVLELASIVEALGRSARGGPRTAGVRG